MCILKGNEYVIHDCKLEAPLLFTEYWISAGFKANLYLITHFPIIFNEPNYVMQFILQ